MRPHQRRPVAVVAAALTVAAVLAGLALASGPRGIATVRGVSILSTSSCAPHSRACVAVGTTYDASGSISHADVVPITNGVAGRTVALPIGEYPEGGTCAAPGDCWLAGTVNTPQTSMGALIPFKSGRLGTAHTFSALGAFSGGISCPTKTVCWAAGVGNASETAYVVRFDPATGASHVYSLSTRDLIFSAGEGGDHAFVCPTSTACVALGRTNFSPTSKGTETVITNGRITTLHIVTGTSAFGGIACPTASVCEGVGTVGTSQGHGVFVRFVNHRPSHAIAAATTSWLAGVSCTNASRCDAVGFGIKGTGQHTTAYATIARLSGLREHTQVVLKDAGFGADTCVNAKLCWAVGYRGAYPNQVGITDGFLP